MGHIRVGSGRRVRLEYGEGEAISTVSHSKEKNSLPADILSTEEGKGDEEDISETKLPRESLY